MRKLLYMAATGIAIGGLITACDNEPKNPGDFSIKSQMSLSDIVSQKTGTQYPLRQTNAFDTVLGNMVTVYDSIFDDQGEFVERKGHDSLVNSKVTTRFIEFEPIMLPVAADTFAINITTNARWVSPQPTKPRGASQIYNDATTSGGGNGTLIFRTDKNINATRQVPADMYIYTSDSTIMYKIPLLQEGEL